MDVGTYLRVMPPLKKKVSNNRTYLILLVISLLILESSTINSSEVGKKCNKHTSFFPRPCNLNLRYFFVKINCQQQPAPPENPPCSDWDSKSRMGKWLPADSASLRMRYLGGGIGGINGLRSQHSNQKRWDSEKTPAVFEKNTFFFWGGGKE